MRCRRHLIKATRRSYNSLLDNGAEVNAQGGEYGNALQAASNGGHDIVRWSNDMAAD